VADKDRDLNFGVEGWKEGRGISGGGVWRFEWEDLGG
jgi:hypothetical protein